MERPFIDPRRDGHWQIPGYKQRITTAQWKNLLLREMDSVIYKGKLTPLVAKKLGYGVVEISKEVKKGIST